MKASAPGWRAGPGPGPGCLRGSLRAPPGAARRPVVSAFWPLPRLCQRSVGRSMELPRLRLLVDGVGLPAVESGEPWSGTPCLIWEDARVLPLRAWEEIGRMWCHTRVQGLASVVRVQAGGCVERETGRNGGGEGQSCEHFGERTGSEGGQECKGVGGEIPAASERAIGRGGWNRGS